MDDAAVYTLLQTDASCSDYLVLPFEARQKARQRALTAAGTEVWLKLPRGSVLRAGARLANSRGDCLEIVAADEALSVVDSDEPEQLARIAYHLGNRHVWVEVGPGQVKYLFDPVLDDMVTKLGATVRREHGPFEPEVGAYTHHAHD